MVNNMEIDLCAVSRRDYGVYKQIIASSNIPPQCPIPAGVYSIRNFQIDLNKYPLLKQGFDVHATFKVVNGDQILSKIDARCVAQ